MEAIKLNINYNSLPQIGNIIPQINFHAEKEVVYVIIDGAEVKRNGILARVISEINMMNCLATVLEVSDVYSRQDIKNHLKGIQADQPNAKVIDLCSHKLFQNQ